MTIRATETSPSLDENALSFSTINLSIERLV
jgi:hypothetical protein